MGVVNFKARGADGSESCFRGRLFESCGLAESISSDRIESKESLKSNTEAMVSVAQFEGELCSEKVAQIPITSLKDIDVFSV